MRLHYANKTVEYNNRSKASLRLRLFWMMKYIHQYKQKKKEKDEHFGFVAKINFFLLSLI